MEADARRNTSVAAPEASPVGSITDRIVQSRQRSEAAYGRLHGILNGLRAPTPVKAASDPETRGTHNVVNMRERPLYEQTVDTTDALDGIHAAIDELELLLANGA